MEKLVEQPTRHGLRLAVAKKPTAAGSLGCLTALSIVTFVPLLVVLVSAMLSMLEGAAVFEELHLEIAIPVGVLALVGIVLLVMRAPVEMELHRDLDLWTTTTASVQSMLPRIHAFALSDVHKIEVERAPRSGAVEGKEASASQVAAFSLTVLDANGAELDGWFLEIESIVTSQHILEFLQRLADVVGLAGYRVTRNDLRQLEAAAYRHLEADMTPLGQAYPGEAGNAMLSADTGQIIPAFDPHSVPFEAGFVVKRWQPGQSIALGKPLHAQQFRGLAMTGTLLLALGIVWQYPWLAGAYNTENVRQGVLPMAMVIVGLFVFINLMIVSFAIRQWLTWCVVIDWVASRFRIRNGSRGTDIAFTRLNDLELRGVFIQGTRGSISSSRSTRGRPDRYRFDVVLYANSHREPGAVLVLASDHLSFQESESVYQCLLSLVAVLAEALEIPHRYSDFRLDSEYAPIDRKYAPHDRNR